MEDVCLNGKRMREWSKGMKSHSESVRVRNARVVFSRRLSPAFSNRLPLSRKICHSDGVPPNTATEHLRECAGAHRLPMPSATVYATTCPCLPLLRLASSPEYLRCGRSFRTA